MEKNPRVSTLDAVERLENPRMSTLDAVVGAVMTTNVYFTKEGYEALTQLIREAYVSAYLPEQPQLKSAN